MPKKKKMSLSPINVQSFVTSLADNEKKDIKGGRTDVRTCLTETCHGCITDTCGCSETCATNCGTCATDCGTCATVCGSCITCYTQCGTCFDTCEACPSEPWVC